MTKAAIRNLGVLGKDGSGKTTLSEAILFKGKVIKEMGSVVKGNTVMDFEDVEKRRKFSLKTSVAHFNWKKESYNLIDTPAFSAFIHDTLTTMQVIDAGLMVLPGNEEISAQVRYLWSEANKNGVPTMGVITHLDKEDGDFNQTITNITKKFGKKPIILQIPYGEKGNFKGFTDLVNGKLYEYPMDKSGKVEIKDVPADYADKVENARMEMLEEVAMINDELTEKFMDEMDLTPEETKAALMEGFASTKFFPVIIATGEYTLGVERMLDLISEFLPVSSLRNNYMINKGNAEEITKFDSEQAGDFSSLIFKTMVDPFLGNLSIMRVVSGHLENGMEVYNPKTDTDEKITKLYFMKGKELVDTDIAVTGDIVAVAKLKNTNTNDTLCASSKAPFIFETIEKPKPVIQYAITAESKKDEDKMGAVMHKLMAEDPTIELIQDSEMHQLLLAGQGRMQLKTLVEEAKNKYHIGLKLDVPKVQYRETIKGKAEAQGKYKKQSGGKGQYGDCHIRVRPTEMGEGFKFIDKIVGGVIPRNFIPSVEKGLLEAKKTGVLKGYPTIDFEAEVFYGSYHAVDSSDRAFQVAASMAYKKAMPEAKPIVLEPYMYLEIFVEDDLVGTIYGDLSSRRGRVEGSEAADGGQIIKAKVPQVEVMEYEPILNQLTSGNTRFKMEFSHYEEFRGELSDIPRNGEEEEE